MEDTRFRKILFVTTLVHHPFGCLRSHSIIVNICVYISKMVNIEYNLANYLRRCVFVIYLFLVSRLHI